MAEIAYQRIADDVIPYFGKVVHIANNVFVISSLPYGLVEGWVRALLDQADIFVCRHGLEPFDDGRSGDCVGGVMDPEDQV